MSTNNETKLLKTITLVPLSIFIIFSLISMWLMYEYHKQELKYEIKNLREDLTNRYKQMIKKEIYKVHNLIEYEYQSHKKKHKIPQQAIKEHILELIESMHYDKNTYIFILDYNCNNVLHPHKKTLITKKAKLKTQCLQSGTDIIHIAKNGEGYLSYLFMQKNKLSYIKSFEPFQWAIGYGFYPDEIEKMINQNIEKLKTVHLKHLFTVLILTLLITFMLSFILFKLAKKINEIFAAYKKRICLSEKENKEKEDIINHQSKLALIGKMMNIISHQWRQPLSKINSTIVDIYLNYHNNSLNDLSLKKNIHNVETITEYLSQTIDDFSNFFAPHKEQQLFLVNHAIKQCFNIIKPSKHIEVATIYRSNNKIQGYMTLFQQVILTVIINAIDIFKENCVDNPLLVIDTYDEGPFTFIEISDNGGGISEKNLSHIFDLYFSTKSNKKNKGLGLYIAKKIIKQRFAGDITVTNNENGALFQIKVTSNVYK